MKTIGWIIRNGSGWNNHATARAFEDIVSRMPESLPPLPDGVGVIIAPVDSERPFGLRCAIVRLLPRDVTAEGWDDGPLGEPWEWAADVARLDVEKLHSMKVPEQDEDSSDYVIGFVTETLKLAQNLAAQSRAQ